MQQLPWIVVLGFLILLLFLWSGLRERRRILRQVLEEIEVQGAPAGPLAGPAPNPSAVIALLLGAASLFPLVGVLFAPAAFILARRARREAADDTGAAPSHDLAAAATAFAVGGLLASILVIVFFVSGPAAFRPTPFFPDISPPPGKSPFSTSTIAIALVFLVTAAVFHECAHGLVAYWSGDDTARKAGRLTLNPLPHLDPFGSILLPVLLLLMDARFIIGWAKPVPVRVERLRDRRWGAAAVSAAGIGTNLVGVLLFFALFVAFGILVQLLTPVRLENYSSLFQETQVGGSPLHLLALIGQGLKFGVLVNLALAAFNLIPLPPLDGANLLESLLPASFGSFFTVARSVGCLLFPLVMVLAFCLLLPLLFPAAYLLVHVLGAFFVRM